MTNERIKQIAYEPILDAWKVIHMTQNLTQNDEDGWRAYVDAHTAFCRKYNPNAGHGYGYYLAMAIMAIVDEIAKENKT
jgi:trehalose-6-phosphate synthase